MKTLAFATVFVAVSILAANSASAANVEDQLAELRQRIDSLELENKSLRQAITKPTPVASGPYLESGDEATERPTESIVEPQLNQWESELPASNSTCPCNEENPDNFAMTASWKYG